VLPDRAQQLACVVPKSLRHKVGMLFRRPKPLPNANHGQCERRYGHANGKPRARIGAQK